MTGAVTAGLLSAIEVTAAGSVPRRVRAVAARVAVLVREQQEVAGAEGDRPRGVDGLAWTVSGGWMALKPGRFVRLQGYGYPRDCLHACGGQLHPGTVPANQK